MTKKVSWIGIIAGGLFVLALVLVVGINSAYAQTDEGAEDAAPLELLPGYGRHAMDGDRGEALAETLGITVEELEAAHEEARAAAIEQAIADGLITQEQAEGLLANGFNGRRLGLHAENQTYLADALGITVEELEAAKLEVQAAHLAEMVADGVITQEQADLMLARKAVQGYVDRDALQSTAQSLYEDAVNEALDAGAITQEQADELLSNQSFGPRGFGGGFGHHGRHGGPRGFGPSGSGFGPANGNGFGGGNGNGFGGGNA